MSFTLGIDTGGTYTDVVLLDHNARTVAACAKALTTYHDLAVGIGQAVSAVLSSPSMDPAEVGLAALSSTLATNAIVEGRGSPVCLILIGYDPALIAQYGFEQCLVTDNVVYIDGGHDGEGTELRPLDERTARAAIRAQCDQVEAFAVSAYFGVRNPAHERRVRALIEEMAGLPVTCGHELTTRLDAVRRATTAALNARLIPLIRELIATVRATLDGLGIHAPLMVVRGDGSLVRAEWAMRRPIETVLSGPAASVLGAWHLAGRRECWVVDMGGTTTDIAALREGRPRLNAEGAQVGGWQTMVEAVDVHTVGLGGDSLVSLDPPPQVAIGPRRAIPLCVLADQHPAVIEELDRLVGSKEPLAGQFVLAYRESAHGLSESETALLRDLAAGPRSLAHLLDEHRYGLLLLRQIEALEARRLVARAGFTPTDALHVLGRFVHWNARAAGLGAQIMAAQAGMLPEALCEHVAARVSERMAAEVIGKALRDEAAPADWADDAAGRALLDRALGRVPDSDLGVTLTLRQPVVAIGAPAQAYGPCAARHLHTELIVPAHAEVASAVGAAVGGVVQQVRVLIRPLNAERIYRLHLPDGVRDFDSLDEGVRYAQQVVPEALTEQARQAGADQVEVHMTRVDRNVPVTAGWGQHVYLGTDLTFTAVGRPSPAGPG